MTDKINKAITDRVEKFKEKRLLITKGINEMNLVKESLFSLKQYFYGDFKHSKALGKVPRPNDLIQSAIEYIEKALEEAFQIEINSI